MKTEITLYEKIGKENLQRLVTMFYENVRTNEIIAPLFKGNFEEIEEKQYCFLTQFLGGPSLYTNKYGHPRMRMRHLPHPIDNRAKEAWLDCMKRAIDNLHLEKNLADALYNCFPLVAQHMVNQ